MNRRFEWDIDNNGNGCLAVFCDACVDAKERCEACEDAKELEEEWCWYEAASRYVAMKPPSQPRPEGKR